ncbi:MAG: T9SS type A sorting domain-containing protein [Candidatus Eisenbacteria bacterium]|nr:T9SS type A sorting domain-containing protein [Candidatus Eisenbacteria bacterium]
MKSFIRISILALVLVSTVFAGQALAGWKPQVVLGPGIGSPAQTPYHQTWNRTLSADTLYVLTGFYYVDSTYSITIPEGTTVLGDTASVLCIQRGAQIHATGSAERPIVFAPLKDPGNRNPGDWGGVIILGEAPCNRVEPVIEGGLIEGHFGGNDPADDSGEFYYCRIEYPGYRIEEGNEVNGLTMGGVGSETEIHHVQVSYSNDDSFEWFGGVQGGGRGPEDTGNYLVALGGIDDVFDTDFGHQGCHQFCFHIRDPLWSDLEGQANGFESDSYKPAATTPPVTDPTFASCTIVGPERTDDTTLPPVHAFEYAACIRRCSLQSLFNSVIMGFPYGLTIRDGCTQTGAINDDMNFHYTSIQASQRPSGSTSVHDEGRWAGVTAWFDAEPGNNPLHSQPRLPSSVGLTDMSDLNDPDPTPLVTSELVTTPANWAHSECVDCNFEQVSYRGAFAPGLTMDEQWTAGWTEFDPQNAVYDEPETGADDAVASGKVSSQNYPNPFNPVTNIAYSVQQAGPVTIEVYNISGKLVKTLLSEELTAGASGTVVWDGTDEHGQKCASGVYFARVSTPDLTQSHKMVMLK